MTPAEKDAATIGTLRAQVDELEETIRQMKETNTGEIQFPFEWGLTRSQRRGLLALYRAPNGFLRRESLVESLVAKPFWAVNPINTMSAQIVKMRKQLRPFGIEILTRCGQGFEVPASSRAIIKAAIEQRSEVQTPELTFLSPDVRSCVLKYAEAHDTSPETVIAERMREWAEHEAGAV